MAYNCSYITGNSKNDMLSEIEFKFERTWVSSRLVAIRAGIKAGIKIPASWTIDLYEVKKLPRAKRAKSFCDFVLSQHFFFYFYLLSVLTDLLYSAFNCFSVNLALGLIWTWLQYLVAGVNEAIMATDLRRFYNFVHDLDLRNV